MTIITREKRSRSRSVFSPYECIPARTSLTPPHLKEVEHLDPVIALRPAKYTTPRPFGVVVGMSCSVHAYSNGEDATSYATGEAACVVCRGVRLGIIAQCVEFARRWLYVNKGVVFSDVRAAADIWSCHFVTDVEVPGMRHPFQNIPNGSYVLPQMGDLIIYDKRPWMPYGHVSVIVGINLHTQQIKIAEQNYLNAHWEKDDEYARVISFINVDGRIYLQDAGPIIGLKRPLVGGC